MTRSLCKALFFVTVFVLLTGCAESPPAQHENVCAIFTEKSDWYDAAKEMQGKWHIPFYVPLAMMEQESSFQSDVHPPETYLLGFIPWGYVSSAYGYAQAKDEVWEDYQDNTGHTSADREDFGDALDFMAWYMSKSRHYNKVPYSNAYAHYLNYHEGWGGYRRGTYRAKKWLMGVAGKVSNRAERYKRQYASCKARLDKKDDDGFLGLF
ncbi:transglycosylase SLT domain-containing protein [Entomobacter blattae]|uniref:Transglycosylase SLT domain-containing protein n=1 Tax=Entomobacter blattae TaxID=2762277 RepID=A0A7H1NQY1_9PROT|nr:hypothetical protein [Entomobacter blattae]QNT78191.1 hypothetical protein JGUZn3_09600 [Entomobacter blattae]